MQVEKGTVLVLDLTQRSSPQIKSYWNLDSIHPFEGTAEEASAELRELFMESIRLHLRSDVPLGAALSGGVDSSSIVMTMRKILGKNSELHAFSYFSQDPEKNEERWAKKVVEASGAILHPVQSHSENLTHDMRSLITFQGEPFSSTSIYAQYRVFQTAAQAGIKVMLDGQGADELFGGYSQFWNAQVASFLKKGDWRSAYTLTKNLKKNESHPRLRSQAKQVLEVLSFFLPDSLGGIGKKVLGKGIFPSWLDAKWFMNRGILPRDEFKVSRVSLDPFREKVAQSLTQSSLPMLLRYEDRNSMRFSIESRVPFLAPDLIRFAHSLPSKYLLPKNGISKYVFRQAMRGIVPDEILDRRDKIGFETPQVAWLKSNSAWVHQILNSAYASKIPFFNQKEIKKMESKIPVWRLVNFIFWAEQLSVELE